MASTIFEAEFKIQLEKDNWDLETYRKKFEYIFFTQRVIIISDKWNILKMKEKWQQSKATPHHCLSFMEKSCLDYDKWLSFWQHTWCCLHCLPSAFKKLKDCLVYYVKYSYDIWGCHFKYCYYFICSRIKGNRFLKVIDLFVG